MAEKPTFQTFLDDLALCPKRLPYAEHTRIWPEGQVTVNCKEGTLVLSAAVQPSNIV